MDFIEALNTYFPEAAAGQPLTRNVTRILKTEGLDPAQTLLATSTCPDEFNQTVKQFAEPWGPAFQMGGLAGLPFTGQSGFDAFRSHVPDHGAALLIYASHVGITSNGELGRVVRKGQLQATLSCGSAISAYLHLEKGGSPDELDGQQRYVTSIVAQHREEIEDSAQPMALLPILIYEAIDSEIRELIPTDFDRPIVLLGGIQINAPVGEIDYCLVREFSLKQPDGSGWKSLKEKL